MNSSAYKTIAGMSGVEILTNKSLKSYTGFATGGDADYIAIPQSLQAFIDAVNTLRKHGERFFILGNGSNVLALDEGYRGWIVLTKKALGGVAFNSDSTVEAGAGVNMSSFCMQCAERGLSGLEFAYGIPGSVGGAVFMDAGAYGGEIKDVLESATVLDEHGNVLRLENKELEFGYRTSAIQSGGYIVIGARFKLAKSNRAEITARMHDFMQQREDKQPLDYPSCGSTFKRPVNGYASKLIDDCGLRGKTIGGAAVSDKHCGFVVNKSGATSSDVLELIEYIKQAVKEKTGVTLEKEIRILK